MRMETANSDALSAEIEDLSADIAGDEAELKISLGIREKEAAAFAAEESADKEFLAMFKDECAGTDAEWEERQISWRRRHALKHVGHVVVKMQFLLTSVWRILVTSSFLPDCPKCGKFA